MPVGGVTVTLEGLGSPAYQTTTDPQGAFRIDGLKPGSYRANYAKTGFIPLERDSPARRAFTIVSGSDPLHLDARLTPFSKLLGRVLDTDGNPVASSELLLNGALFGRSATSDKEGNFSFQVPPGRYQLLARPPKDMKPPPTGHGERLGWMPTFYPGVVDPQAAGRIVLAPGAGLFGFVIRLRIAPLLSVRGMLLDTAGNPAPNIAVNAARPDETLSEDISTVSLGDGSFEFPALYSGEWNIFAEQRSGGRKLTACVTLQLGDRDQDGIQLRLSAPYTVRGTVTVKEGGGFKEKIDISLRPPVIAGSQGLSHTVVEKDGTFKLDDVYPGSYKVVVTTANSSYFLSSLMLGDRDILGQYVELGPGALPIRATFDMNGGRVRGKVEDCGSATIVLMPREKALQDAQFVQSGNCKDGQFELSNLRPGDYYAFALDRWEGAWDFLSSIDQTLINQAVSVHVNAREVAIADLRVISRGP